MNRRHFLAAASTSVAAAPLCVAIQSERWGDATSVLQKSVESKAIDAAVLHVRHKNEQFTRPFGTAKSGDALFLLGSISKPINVAALMTLFDQGKFRLEDPVCRFIPEFTGEERENVTIGHLLTHVSGLPDQVQNNNALRRQHAPLEEFVHQTVRTPPGFAPGTRYQYSSMGILLAARIGELLSGFDMLSLVEKTVFERLSMKHSVQGLGTFRHEELVACQMDGAAPESGGGDPQTKEWDWNSVYWRKLGAPWGGTHASAPDLGTFLDELLYARGRIVRPETARLMTRNHHPKGFPARGLGFAMGPESGSSVCSEQTFGHTGSTGTLCWADPATETICVVLTSLPRRALQPHPREVAADCVARDARR
jgi:CubicO group peptidase (beta-lactamase class C family)